MFENPIATANKYMEEYVELTYVQHIAEMIAAFGAASALWFLIPLMIQTLSVAFSLISLAISLSLTVIFSSGTILFGMVLASIGLYGMGKMFALRSESSERIPDSQAIINNSILIKLAEAYDTSLLKPVVSRNFDKMSSRLPNAPHIQYKFFSLNLDDMKSGLATVASEFAEHVSLGLTIALDQALTAFYSTFNKHDKSSNAVRLESLYSSIYTGVAVGISKIQFLLDFTMDYIVPLVATAAAFNGVGRTIVLIRTGNEAQKQEEGFGSTLNKSGIPAILYTSMPLNIPDASKDSSQLIQVNCTASPKFD